MTTDLKNDLDRARPGELLMLLLLLACRGGFESGASEAFRIRQACSTTVRFRSGTAESRSSTPRAPASSSQRQGRQVQRACEQGRVSIGMAFEDVSDSCWSSAGSPDVAGLEPALLRDRRLHGRVPYGLGTILFVTFDGDGNGPAYRSSLCVLPDYADQNFLACDPTVPPQDTILSLVGHERRSRSRRRRAQRKVVSPKAPTTVPPTRMEIDGAAIDVPRPRSSLHSNGNCDIDGLDSSRSCLPGAAPGDYRST
jgi:hypothetical protein